MKIDFAQGRVTLAVVPFDLRYGYYRLSQICSEFLRIDLTRGEDFVVFISRTRHTAKIVHCDRKGSLLLTRTLHQGKFQQLITRAEGVAAEPLTVQELEKYLDGEVVTVVRTSVLKG